MAGNSEGLTFEQQHFGNLVLLNRNRKPPLYGEFPLMNW